MLWDIVIVAACVIAALAFLFVVTRSLAAPARKESNDSTGAVVAVIGTTYAVILAFMLSGVWNMLLQAQANAEREANALVNIWRIGDELPADLAQPTRSLCQKYAEDVVSLEWPAMEAGKPMPPESSEVMQTMWKLAGQSQTLANSDSIASYQFMEELRTLSECRRIRLMHSREQLPWILRAVLVAGGIITVGVSCFFGVPSFRFHVLQVVVLTFLISLVLVAIADLDRPYQGNEIVQPDGFKLAIRTFSNGGD